MPPLHPAFVHFPIALVAFSFIADLLGRPVQMAPDAAGDDVERYWLVVACLSG